MNGVKQGAVLSPILFCVYIDDLLLLLTKAGVGCYIGFHFVGALAYADDIVLVAPSASALRTLLATCDDYARKFCITFNAIKSKCLVALPRRCNWLRPYLQNCTFFIGNRPIEYVNQFTHLGHIISDDLSDDDDIITRCNHFIGQVNNVLCYFRGLTPSTIYKLFRSYCTSFFGSELWLLSNSKIESLCVAWRKAVRRVWNMPSQAHTHFLPLICNCFPILDELCRRQVNFAKRCISHPNEIVKFVSSHGLLHARGYSPFGQRVAFCELRYNFTLAELISSPITRIISMHLRQQTDADTVRLSDFVAELLLLREGAVILPGTSALSYDDLQCMIDYVCTH